MASTSTKKPKPAAKQKSLIFSFANDDSVICIDDNDVAPILPKVNLNNTIIDLTESVIEEPANNSQGKKKIPKTIHLDMQLNSPGPSTRVLRSKPSQTRLREIEPEPSRQVPRISYNPPNEAGPSRHVPRVPLRPSINEPCYQKLQEMMDKPLIENYEDFYCVLCKSLVRKGEGVLLKECLHSFCRMCLIHVINKTTPGKIRVDCPHVPEICESFITIEEIKSLLGDDFEEFTRKMSDEDSAEALLPLLLDMDDLEVLPNFKPFQCQVCFGDIEIGEGITLKNCLHNGCKECLAQLIGHAEEFQVQCPYVEGDNGCKEYIQEREMRYLVTTEVFEKHLKKSLKIAEHINELNFHCRALNCENFVELMEGITSFVCQVCSALNCVPCKAVHPGKNCTDYQEDANPELKNSRLQNEIKKSEEAIAAEIAKGTAMHCPRCQIPVIKITGCDHITCTACKLGICWATRKPRKSFEKGNGETVEGCKCKEPPLMKRCHPKCGGCH